MESTKTKRSMRKRRQYTPEFKAGAVRLVLDEGKSVTDVALGPGPDPFRAERVGAPGED